MTDISPAGLEELNTLYQQTEADYNKYKELLKVKIGKTYRTLSFLIGDGYPCSINDFNGINCLELVKSGLKLLPIDIKDKILSSEPSDMEFVQRFYKEYHKKYKVVLRKRKNYMNNYIKFSRLFLSDELG